MRLFHASDRCRRPFQVVWRNDQDSLHHPRPAPHCSRLLTLLSRLSSNPHHLPWSAVKPTQRSTLLGQDRTHQSVPWTVGLPSLQRPRKVLARPRPSLLLHRPRCRARRRWLNRPGGPFLATYGLTTWYRRQRRLQHTNRLPQGGPPQRRLREISMVRQRHHQRISRLPQGHRALYKAAAILLQ